MAYIQKSKPPVNKIYSFSFKDFSGGLNNASDQLDNNELSNVLNMMFCDETLLEKRNGQQYYDELKLDGPILHIDYLRPYTDEDKLIRATDKKMYVGSNLVKTLAGEMTGVNHMNQYIFADGNKLYAYGKFPQASKSPYVEVIGTAVNDYVVMEIVSPADNHAKLDSNHVTGVTKYNYTNMTITYEPCEFEYADAYQGANKVPTGVKFVVSHKGRLYLSGSSKDNDNVFISAVNNPYYYPVSLPIQLPPNSDYIVGMHVYNDGVVVGRRDDMHIIVGDTNNPALGLDVFQRIQLNTHTGFANHKAIDIVDNYLFYLGDDGKAYALYASRYDENNLMTVSISDKLDLFKPPINLEKTDITEACSIFFDNMWYLSIKDVVLIYSFKKKGWTLYRGLNARSFFNDKRTLIWGNEEGRIAKHTDDYLDFGEPYQAFIHSKRFDMTEPNTYKHFRDFFLVVHVYDDRKTNINIVYEIDYSDVKSGAKVEQHKSVFGKTKWGDRFINRNVVETVPITIGQRGRNFVFKISNGYYVSEIIDSVNDLDSLLGKKEGLLVKTSDTGKYYLYTNYEWQEMTDADLNQPMKIYQINGDYELRGKR